MNPRLAFATLILPFWLGGCTQIPHYTSPKTDLPNDTAWLDQPAIQEMALALDEAEWWSALSGSPTLNVLIDQALKNNHDIALAKLQLEQARLLVKQSQSATLPELNATSGLRREQLSDQSFPASSGVPFNTFSLAGLLSYEVDLWGRIDALNQQAIADYKASQADQKTVQLSVTTTVAQVYLSLMALNQQIAIAKEAVQSRSQTVTLRQTQLQYGQVTPLTVHQAEAELAAVKIAWHQKQAQRDLQTHALAVLVGQSPRELAQTIKDGMDTQPLTEYSGLPMAPALPSKLLQRRPDIVAMEQRLVAANANIGVAKAALFPSLSLTGLLGFQSDALNQLVTRDALTWRADAAITAPIFDYGKRQSQVQLSQAQQHAMVIQYQQTIRVAFKEVWDALTQLNSSTQQLQTQRQQIAALNQILALAQTRFDAGYSSYLEVLDAQRSLFNAELTLVTMMLDQSATWVALYKALGGSWKM